MHECERKKFCRPHGRCWDDVLKDQVTKVLFIRVPRAYGFGVALPIIYLYEDNWTTFATCAYTLLLYQLNIATSSQYQ